MGLAGRAATLLGLHGVLDDLRLGHRAGAPVRQPTDQVRRQFGSIFHGCKSGFGTVVQFQVLQSGKAPWLDARVMKMLVLEFFGRILDTSSTSIAGSSCR